MGFCARVGVLALDFRFELPKPRPFLKEFRELIRTEEVVIRTKDL